MRHHNKLMKLNKTASHRRAMLRNLLTALFEQGAIITTKPKSKLVKKWADRMIIWGKKGDLHSRRLAARYLFGKIALQELFDRWAPSMGDRDSGFTRTVNYKIRKGDGAQLTLIHLIGAINEGLEGEEEVEAGKSEPKEE